jgi:hypothetical protein
MSYYVVCRTYVGPDQAEYTDRTRYYVTQDCPTYPCSPWGPVAEGSSYTHGDYKTTLCGILETLAAASGHAQDLASQEDDANPGYREIVGNGQDWWLLQYRPGVLQPMSPEGTRQWAEANRPFWRLNADDDVELIAVAAGCEAQAEEGILLDIATLEGCIAEFIDDVRYAASSR